MTNEIIINILWILVGYFVGSINASIIITSISKEKEHIKTVGSKNAGATNAMRSFGWRFGLLIFFLDVSKSYWFALTLGLLQTKVSAFSSLIPQLATLFVIIGHIFPIFFKFKGGKGAATLLGMISSISLILAAIGTILFFLVVFITRYVSLGSIIVPYWLASLSFINPYFNGWYDSSIHYGPYWLSPLMLFLGCIIVTLSHYSNIVRLIKKEERQISLSFIDKQKSKQI